jgi:channel protein (hemolysin III family)
MIALYSASTLLHGAKCSRRTHMWFNRLDHMAIFLLIASRGRSREHES